MLIQWNFALQLTQCIPLLFFWFITSQLKSFRLDCPLYHFSVFINDWPRHVFNLSLEPVPFSNHLYDVVKTAFNLSLSFYDLSMVFGNAPNRLTSLFMLVMDHFQCFNNLNPSHSNEFGI